MTLSEPQVMGILNVTPDSFYASSRCDTTDAIEKRVGQMLDEGADLPTNAVNPTPSVISAGDKAMVRMNENGGFVLRLEPMD